MLGPYIKSRGTGGTKMSANADLILVETYVQGKRIENQIFIYRPKYKFFAIWGALWGAFNDQTGPILLSNYPLTHVLCMWNKESNW